MDTATAAATVQYLPLCPPFSVPTTKRLHIQQALPRQLSILPFSSPLLSPLIPYILLRDTPFQLIRLFSRSALRLALHPDRPFNPNPIANVFLPHRAQSRCGKGASPSPLLLPPSSILPLSAVARRLLRFHRLLPPRDATRDGGNSHDGHGRRGEMEMELAVNGRAQLTSKRWLIVLNSQWHFWIHQLPGGKGPQVHPRHSDQRSVLPRCPPSPPQLPLLTTSNAPSAALSSAMPRPASQW